MGADDANGYLYDDDEADEAAAANDQQLMEVDGETSHAKDAAILPFQKPWRDTNH